MRVLVTRPEPGASATAARLRELGHEPVVLPLSEIAAVDAGDLPEAAGFDAVAVTSATALRYAPDGLGARYGVLLCFTVGERTGEAAADAGFTKVISADGDVDALIKLVSEILPAGSRVLYPCGRRRRPVLETELTRRGYAVTALETYRTDAIDYSTADAQAVLGEGPLDAVLVYSRFSAERLADFVSASALAPLFEATHFLCMSGQVAGGLSDEMQDRAEIAVDPSEDELLVLLGRAPQA
jgi:uroporphyrinogen-III synthase